MNETTPFMSKKVIAPPNPSNLYIGNASKRESHTYIPSHVDSNVNRNLGVLIGFFFPVFSLPVLCLSTLKMKYGVVIGHVLNYTCGVVITITLALLISLEMPEECGDHDMKECMEQVQNGTNVNEWIAYMAQCNDTSTESFRLLFPLNTIMKTAKYEDIRYHNMCPALDSFEDEVGSQSEECAGCICFNREEFCKLLNDYHYWLWVLFAMVVLGFLFSLGATHHYMQMLSIEEDKNCMLLKMQM